MSRVGASAYRPYVVAMIGAFPPFYGDIITYSSHHSLILAMKGADRWCDSIGALGVIPWWPFSFGVIDVRNGEHVYVTDETERHHSGKRR